MVSQSRAHWPTKPLVWSDFRVAMFEVSNVDIDKFDRVRDSFSIHNSVNETGSQVRILRLHSVRSCCVTDVCIWKMPSQYDRQSTSL